MRVILWNFTESQNSMSWKGLTEIKSSASVNGVNGDQTLNPGIVNTVF